MSLSNAFELYIQTNLSKPQLNNNNFIKWLLINKESAAVTKVHLQLHPEGANQSIVDFYETKKENISLKNEQSIGLLTDYKLIEENSFQFSFILKIERDNGNVTSWTNRDSCSIELQKRKDTTLNIEATSVKIVGSNLTENSIIKAKIVDISNSISQDSIIKADAVLISNLNQDESPKTKIKIGTQASENDTFQQVVLIEKVTQGFAPNDISLKQIYEKFNPNPLYKLAWVDINNIEINTAKAQLNEKKGTPWIFKIENRDIKSCYFCLLSQDESKRIIYWPSSEYKHINGNIDFNIPDDKAKEQIYFEYTNKKSNHLGFSSIGLETAIALFSNLDFSKWLSNNKSDIYFEVSPKNVYDLILEMKKPENTAYAAYAEIQVIE